MCNRWQAATGEWCRLAAERTHIGRNKKSPAAVPGFQVHSPVPSENLIRWIRSGKENRIMIETDGDRLQTSARIYVGLLSFA